MKISLINLCIVTLVLLLCCFAVETEAKAKKCKAPLKWNAKLKKCTKPKKGGPKKTTAAGGSTAAADAAATTAAPA
ncbi:uncharacterized protein LOC108038853 [Drosophila rhopaloa]|uniref:Uncharacterized protein n=1 Tax=Drosophila rhopaloa TaxID=1041015 RepID=A0ABM5GXF9_DRORH|nr:uncharacterized protein LOC108038853 [Drosophila rhopaloa]